MVMGVTTAATLWIVTVIGLILCEDGPTAEQLRSTIIDAGYKVTTLAPTETDMRRVRCRLTWGSRQTFNDIPPVVDHLRQQQGVVSIAASLRGGPYPHRGRWHSESRRQRDPLCAGT